ncbi:hypothetical protein GIB67_020505 [Kingdonia uniflora]|uniref:ADP,ATP carrier protein n=1 Tax=Kingdonia uniflora TaxID=39325 RepID=A0A7J7PBQ3_9MAGN|nr:hypothetical protein GIB67_020505 [Kingdonia uniflora]
MVSLLQTRVLLSLPSNLKTRAFNTQNGVKHRVFVKPFGEFEKKLNGVVSKTNANNGFSRKAGKLQICRAEGGTGDGQAYVDGGDVVKKVEFLGIEIGTLKKIIPLGLMFFCILFNYTILRDTKDVLVVTAKGSSAEIIPFLKTWVNLPMAIGFMLIYSKLLNVLSKQALFYTVMVPFIAFLGAFGFFLYPLSGVMHPTALADKLLAALGPRFLGPIAILRIWSFCRTVKYFSNLRKHLGPGVDGWAISLKGMMSIVVLMGLTICGIYWWVNTFVPLPSRTKKLTKSKMGTMKSLKFLVSSRYVRDLATLVVAYGISINLVEVTWKSKLKAQFPSPNEYSAFMGDFSMATGIATFTMMLLSQWIFNKYGWGVAAKITPTVLLITGAAFFSLILFGGPLAPVIGSLGMTPLLAAVYVGAMQNIFSKSSKYSLFDPCKEMAYIPLDEETKIKGKAAIDVVCNPLGKSGGALIQQFMILTFGSLANSTPYLGGVLLVIVLAWLTAAKSLDSQFTTALHKEEEFEEEIEMANNVKVPLLS